MISLTFLWKNGTNIANGKFQFVDMKNIYSKIRYIKHIIL